MKKHQGGCQCGKVRYEADVDLEKAVVECNCSICGKQGLLLTFLPNDAVTVISGEDNLTEYRFGTEKIAHFFCTTCGVQSFARGSKSDGTPTYALNVRTIDDIDLTKIEKQFFDGRSK